MGTPAAPRLITAPDSRKLAVSEFGDPGGAPVIWCHGGLSSRVDAALAQEGLARAGVRLISADRPGIGGSDRQRGRVVADWARDVEVIADALGVDRFAVAGWSAGGPFALACAAKYPDRVTSVATIGGMAPIRSRHELKELGLATDRLMIPLSRRAPPLAATIFGITKRMKPERLKARLLKSIPEPDRAILAPLPASVAVGYTVAALEPHVQGTVDDYRAFGGGWGVDLAQISAPVRCWQGADDTLLPMTHARRLVDALPTGTLEAVPAAGHFLWIPHTAEVFGRLLEDARR